MEVASSLTVGQPIPRPVSTHLGLGWNLFWSAGCPAHLFLVSSRFLALWLQPELDHRLCLEPAFDSLLPRSSRTDSFTSPDWVVLNKSQQGRWENVTTFELYIYIHIYLHIIIYIYIWTYQKCWYWPNPRKMVKATNERNLTWVFNSIVFASFLSTIMTLS